MQSKVSLKRSVSLISSTDHFCQRTAHMYFGLQNWWYNFFPDSVKSKPLDQYFSYKTGKARKNLWGWKKDNSANQGKID